MIVLDSVTKRFGHKVLFEGVSAQFDRGKRYGITGANGAGKSTFLKLVAGVEESDGGSITLPSSTRIGILKQNHFEYEKERIVDTVMMGNKILWNALTEKEKLLHKEIDEETGLRLGELEGIIAEEDGYTAESEAVELLVGLGVPSEKQQDAMSTLPPGYKLRVLLAQVLFGKSDVLLLDEPTNHLDLDSIRWLEAFLIEYAGTALVVSHDRHFLNAIATHIADLDYQTITLYTGNYSSFVQAKYEQKQRAASQATANKKKVAELQEFVQRFGTHASKSKQAQSRIKQIEKLEESIKTQGPKRSSLVRPFVRFEFKQSSGRDILRIEGVYKSFGQKKIFENLSLHFNRGDRVAVIGPSGIGKSTLLKMLVGAYERLDSETKPYTLTPNAGTIRWGHDASVGYFAQDHHEALGETAKGKTAFEWLYMFDPTAAQETIRGILGRLLFSGEAALKKTDALSGGEAARLLLAKLVLGKPNVLVLDEPTNHLDIESIEGLLEGLLLFKGTVLFVSHDRHFVERLATRIFSLQPGKATDFPGTYSEWIEKQTRY
ncbi:ribosomal protection-like ABC-F family protein [Pajaroellobacter abortibovis]|uniref:ABC-F family ATPase n=1 Tax=Pajaroellobacter abortibovis TaxID=1882918 RepID=A0A1L6MWH9_9BACT|nr:ATP-binding cassette domain-containing protein [Pajaroellobacter abortibovis]APR99795.1 ABC-F family ATPase [Pajaroellobacter abortibovis]